MILIPIEMEEDYKIYDVCYVLIIFSVDTDKKAFWVTIIGKNIHPVEMELCVNPFENRFEEMSLSPVPKALEIKLQ
jgi:hypothetical protein